jgi:hypothetical protein
MVAHAKASKDRSMFRQPLDLRGRRIGAKYVPQGRFQHLVAPAADALNRGSCLDVGDDANPSRRAYERQLGSRAGDARFLVRRRSRGRRGFLRSPTADAVIAFSLPDKAK